LPSIGCIPTIDIPESNHRHAMALPSSSVHWILCACSLRWRRAIRTAIRLRTSAGSLAAAVRETADHAQCLALLEQHPASFVTLTADPDDFRRCLDLTRTIDRRFADARVAILRSCEDDVPEAWLEQEIAVREAGAGAVVRSIWNIDGLLDRVRRHIIRACPSKLPITERIWAELPWGELGG
jgi:hypothetical protein